MLKILKLSLIFTFFVSYSQTSDSLMVDKYLKLSRESENRNPSIAFSYIDKIEAYSEKNNYTRGLVVAKTERAHVYYAMREYDSALLVFKNNKLELLKLDLLDKARLINLKGVIFQEKGNIDSSLVYLGKSLAIYKQIDNSEGIITTLNNLGILFYQLGLMEEALLSFENSYNFCLKHKNYKNLTETTINYATLLSVNNKIEKAKTLFDSLLDNENLTNMEKIAIFINWATILQSIDVDESHKWYQKSLDFSIANNIPIASDIYIGLGNVYLLKDKPKRALGMFYNSIKLSPVFKEKRIIYMGIANSYSKLNNIDSVNFYWGKLNSIVEKEYNKKTIKAISDTRKNIENYKKDIDIEILTKDIMILAEKNRTNNFIVLSLVLLSLLVISFIIWYKKQQKLKNNQLVNEIELKKNSLLIYALKTTQKNQLLSSLKEKIDTIDLNNKQDITSLKKEISTTITQSVLNDKDWEQFEIYFNDIYKDFYRQLKDKWPDLTDNDLRVCSMVKLRFTIKEISNLLFLSVETVKSTRYRIRKKLKLEQNQNLADFLNNL